MPRVASLYLPDLAIDRLRRIEGRSGTPPDRAPRPPAAVPDAVHRVPEPGTRIENCSCPRGGGWRPGSRWSRDEVQRRIDALPPHQRPPMRELGRRSEAVDPPFRREAERRAPPPPPPASDAPPMVTIERAGQRMVIAALCPLARSLGLTVGMASTQAQALVPDLRTLPAEPEADRALLDRLALFAVRRWTPRAAVSDASGLWLDLDGVAHLFGGEQAMCAHILRYCARLGLSARIAVAGSAGAAHALARHGGAAMLISPAGGEAQAIAPLPIAALRIEPAALITARRMGIERIGELIAMPRGPLARRFGKALLTRIDQALGRIGEPFEPVVARAAPEAILHLVEPIATAEAIEQVVRDLLALLMVRLERRGLGVRALTLLCLRVDGDEQSIEIGTARATRDLAHLHRLLAMHIERIDPGFGIERARLIAERHEPLMSQPIAHGLSGDPPVRDVTQLIDRLTSRLGSEALFRSSLVESDVPERSVRRIEPLGQARGWPAGWPRPVRLLSPPERVGKVVAALPDQPPARFFWRGRLHRVRCADGPERIHGEWWKRAGEAHAVRDYYQVEDDEGARFWLFRRGDGIDPRTGDLSWWLHGAFG